MRKPNRPHSSASSESSAATGKLPRRSFLQASALGTLSVALPQALSGPLANAAPAAHSSPTLGSARAAILISNFGGPSQFETFDPKPQATSQVRGPYQAISTTVPGFQISELLPRHARIAHHFSLVRSVTHQQPAVHELSLQYAQTGSTRQGDLAAPHVGCTVPFMRQAHLEQTNPESLAMLPPGHVAISDTATLASPQSYLLQPCHLGSRYRPLHLAAEFHQAQLTLDITAPESAQLAHAALHRPEVQRAFDLSQEPYAVRARYGFHRLGQACLLSRRLVEAGVTFVTLNAFPSLNTPHATWDTHGYGLGGTVADLAQQVAPMYDQAYSALIEDLVQRGLLASTLVCNLAEFGRSPRINHAGGRDHSTTCYSVGFAGGGIQGGRILGASDAEGAFPAERAVSPTEVLATIYHSLGIDPATTTLPGAQGRRFPLLDTPAVPLHELF